MEWYDVAVIVPLTEEFEVVLSQFQFVANRSDTRRIKFEVALPNTELRILLVKQNVMGKTDCSHAAMDILQDAEVGLFVCIGIAGALSGDLKIGDVCYSGEIVDILDNAKFRMRQKTPKADHLK